MIYENEHLFNYFYKLNDKLIGNISFKNLINSKIFIPNEQRLKDIDKINEIIKYQDTHFKKYNKFNFLGLINIHCCEGKNFLVDGQHRFNAIFKLYEKHNYNKNIDIEVIKVNGMDKLKENYSMINKNTELPEFPDDIDKNIPEKVSEYFFKSYPDVWKNKKTNLRPFLNKNHFQEAIGYLVSSLNKKLNTQHDIEDIKKIITNKNNEMSNWPIESYERNIRKIKKWPEYKEIADKNNFYLGMYCHNSEEYYYDWIKDIIYSKTGEKLKKHKRQRKKSIPPILKTEVWKKYSGDCIEAPCYCCNKTKITCNSYSAGHVIPEIFGGKTTIDNLRPICNSCNSSMGTKNLYEYKNEHYSVKSPTSNKKVVNHGLFSSMKSMFI